MASLNDEATLRTVRGGRRTAAVALRSLMDRIDHSAVTKSRIPELEFERELVLIAYQTLMKQPLMSPAEKLQQKEEEEINKLIDAELSELD